MKTLLLLRHAKSSWKDDSLADRDRPLNDRGLRDAPRIGTLLRDRALEPDSIVTSSAVRALATAEIVAESCGFDAPLDVRRELYLADAEESIEIVRSFDDGVARALVVGHNPGLEELVASLTGSLEHLPTAALARIELDVESWSDVVEGCGRVVDVWRPKEG